MIRNFTLTNALGASFSLMNAQQGAFFEPQGLGFDDATQYEQVGEFFAPLTQRYGQQVITGSMVFGSQPYEHYLTFTKFCQHAPLSLVYETDAGTFQIPCRLTKIEKGDTDGWTYLNCKVEFTALARMYKTVVANNTGTAGGGKVYSEKDLPDITGSIVTIDNAEAGEILNITADINPIQDLHGYDAPWVGGAGKNKLPYPYQTASGSNKGITWVMNSDGTVTLNGTATDTLVISLTSVTQTVIGSGTQRVVTSANASYNPNIAGVNFQTDVYKDGTYVGTIQRDIVSIGITSATSIGIVSRLRITSGTVIPSNTVFYPQIEFGGTTPTAWTPYSNICPISGHTEVDVVVSPTTDAEDGSTYTTALGRTVYGGTLDVVSGLLTVTHAIEDIGDLSWVKSGSCFYTTFNTSSPDCPYPTPTTGIASAISSAYKVTDRNTIENYNGVFSIHYPGSGTTTYITVVDTAYSDAATFKTAMTGQTICYELATPTTYQLTPQQIQAVLGNVWANSGNITITGRKTYGYEYNYTYGDFVADTVTIDSDSVTASPCRISIFGECTNPTWRHYLDGNSVATGYYNGTIPSGHKLVIDTTSSPYSIEEQDIAGNLIADRYELCDFSTERFFLLEYGHNTISVSHTDPDSIRLMVEGYIFYETV